MGQAGSLGGDSLEDVIDERIHDAHGLAGNSSVRVHLFQDFVDVDSVGFPPPPALLLVPSSLGLSLGGSFLRTFRSNFGWHVYSVKTETMNGALLSVDLYITRGGLKRTGKLRTSL